MLNEGVPRARIPDLDVTLLKQAESSADDDPQVAAIKKEAVAAICNNRSSAKGGAGDDGGHKQRACFLACHHQMYERHSYLTGLLIPFRKSYSLGRASMTRGIHCFQRCIL